MKIYCMKCKQKTDTVNDHKAKTKNGRNCVKGNCKVCGTKKSVFVK